MHTGNAKLANKSLVYHLKKDGLISVVLYRKGNFLYEFNDFWLRKYTTKLSIEQLISLTKKMHRFAIILDKLKLINHFNAFIFLENHPHCNFDWYSAPIATHHTYQEVYKWFNEFGLKVINDNNFNNHSLIKKLMTKIYPRPALSVLGRKL
jgi:hypothetical protein